MADRIDFYQEGLIAAELVEDGRADAAQAHIQETLGSIVSTTYRSQINPQAVAKAQKFLARIKDDSGTSAAVKRQSLEFMFFDQDVDGVSLEGFKMRYEKRSVRHLAIAREKPALAATREFLDDLVGGFGSLGRGAAIAATYAITGGPLLAWWLGKKAKDGIVAYSKMAGEERKDLYEKMGQTTKKAFVGTAKFVYHTIDAIVSGAVLGGVFTPTGIRRFFAALEDNLGYPAEDVKGFAMATCGGFSFAISMALILSAYESGDPSLEAQIIKYGIPVALAASALYEIGRAVTKKIGADKERMTSYQSLPKDALFSSPEPPVKARVKLDGSDDDIPVYLDIDGQEERVYVEHGGNPLSAKKMVL